MKEKHHDILVTAIHQLFVIFPNLWKFIHVNRLTACQFNIQDLNFVTADITSNKRAPWNKYDIDEGTEHYSKLCLYKETWWLIGDW